MTSEDWIVFLIVAICFFAIGYVLGDATPVTPTPEDVADYLKKRMPNEWAAYKRGVSEGYQQGHRDCQEHHEPA